MTKRGRPVLRDPDRPPCPRGHEGRRVLDGRSLASNGRFARTRYRCMPDDPGEREHVFIASLDGRRDIGTDAHACPECEHVFLRTGGLAGAHHCSFVIREWASALVRLGEGQSYRRIGKGLRLGIGRTSARGQRRGLTSTESKLVADYIDAFAEIVVAHSAPTEWPAIVALDSWPIVLPDHTDCCGTTGRRHEREDRWGPPDPTRPKIAHSSKVRHVGHVLVATGYEKAGALPRPWLIRFAGAGDETSWAEFLRSLPGKPEWVVSDRDRAITGAVAKAWPGTTHYFCEQHLAANAAEAANRDGIAGTDDPIWPILEAAQHGASEFAAAQGAATSRGARYLTVWLDDNHDLILDQISVRKPFYPRSAGACERVIAGVRAAIETRRFFFRNADRLDRLLALVRNELDDRASAPAYSAILREHIGANGGIVGADWGASRDPAAVSSIAVIVAEAAARAKAANTARHAPAKARRYREQRKRYEAERRALGLPIAPRGQPRILRAAAGSVAGKTVADFGWLITQWHPTRNADLTPEDLPAGSGDKVWWQCPEHPDHEWAAQVRSRTIRGTGCPFCMGRVVAASQSFAVTHSDIAAQWHPTRNGDKTPADFTHGSHYEAWWQCPAHKTHVWRSRVASRTVMMAGCPTCAQQAERRMKASRAKSA